MNCQEMNRLIHAYIDGELDLVRSLEVEQHLEHCPSCALMLKNHQRLRSTMTSGSLYYNSPPGLQKRVQSAVRKTVKSERTLWAREWGWLGAGLSLAAAAILLALILVPAFMRRSSDDLLAQETVSAHVRSLMASHLTDVSSSDQHTVKPWFNGRLDFAPPVIDLTKDGFPLVGGRLDYLNDRPVAALVYRRQQHFINLFIWPSAPDSHGADAPTATVTRRGYHLLHWTRSGMTYWVISDLNIEELKDFVRLSGLD